MASIEKNKKAVEAILPPYLLDEFIDWIANNMTPKDVFSQDQLETWAKDNGFTKESPHG